MPAALALATAEGGIAERSIGPTLSAEGTGGSVVITQTTTVANSEIIWRAWNEIEHYRIEQLRTYSTATTNSVIWGKWNEGWTSKHRGTCWGCDSCGSTAVTRGYGYATTGASESSIISDRTWTTWNYQYEAEAILRADAVTRAAPATIRSDAEWEKRREEEEAQRKAAEAKAETLLRSCLSREQISDLVTKNHFYLTTHDKSGVMHRYRIDRGMQGNVKRVDDAGVVLESLCFHPDGVPVPDTMLAQKLILEADVEFARKTANITPVPPAAPREIIRARGL